MFASFGSLPRALFVPFCASLLVAGLARGAPQGLGNGSSGGAGGHAGARGSVRARHLLVVLADDLPPLESFAELAGFEEEADEGGVTSRSALYPDTPVIDGLAAEGVRFLAFRTSPVCSPTRASLLTGKHVFRHGVSHVVASDHDGPLGAGGLAEFGDAEYASPTIVQALDAAGVRTAVIGKLHLSTWTTQEFSRNPGVYGTGWEIVSRVAAPATFLATQLRNLNQIPVPGGGPGFEGGYYNYFGNVGLDNAGMLALTQYATSWQVDRAIDFYATLRPGDRSFCLLMLNAAHAPYGKAGDPPEPERDFPPAELVATQEYADCVDQAVQNGIPTVWPQYLASVEALDAELGRLLASLPPRVRASLSVLVLGDNGVEPALADGRTTWGKDYGPGWNALFDQHGVDRLKGSVYQWGSTTFGLWSGPGLDGSGLANAGSATWAAVDAVDVAATAADHFDVALFPTDGVSFLPLVHEDVTPMEHARLQTLSEQFTPCGDWTAIATGDAPGETLERGFHRWLRGEEFANGIGGRFSLVRTFTGGAWHDELYRLNDQDGSIVDLFETEDLLLLGGYDEQYAAMVGALQSLLLTPL